jgi:hypothetical protein
MLKQTMYRLAQGVTSVPDGAPSNLRWHSLDNAIRDVQAWIRDSGHLGGYVEDSPRIETIYTRTTFEVRRVEVVDLPPNMSPNDSESGVSGGCRYVAGVRARIYVERRAYREERRKVTAIVDGVEVTGFGPVERTYAGDWFAGWRERPSWREGDRAYNNVHIPIVEDVIEWADDAPALPPTPKPGRSE